MEFIILNSEFEYRVDAHNLIKSVLKDELGNPILRKDLIPKIKDSKINESLSSVVDNCEVDRLPAIGKPLKKDVLYVSEWGLIKCTQSHDRIDYKIQDVPSLFSFDNGKDGNAELIEIKPIIDPEIKTDIKRI